MNALYALFNRQAIRVVSTAQDEAIRAGHKRVGTAQLLLGLSAERTGEAGRALKSMHIQRVGEMRIEVERLIGRGLGYTDYPRSFSERAAQVLVRAVEIYDHPPASTGCILLGLLDDSNSSGCRVLSNLGVELQTLREEVIREIRLEPERPVLMSYEVLPDFNPLF